MVAWHLEKDRLAQQCKHDMLKAIHYLVLITEESCVLRTVSPVGHLNKNYSKKGHILFLKMPNMKALRKRM